MLLEACGGSSGLTKGVLYYVLKLESGCVDIPIDYDWFDKCSKAHPNSVKVIDDYGNGNWYCASNFKINKSHLRDQKLEQILK